MWTKIIIFSTLILIGIIVFIYVKISDFIHKIKQRKLQKKSMLDRWKYGDEILNKSKYDTLEDKINNLRNNSELEEYLIISTQKKKKTIKFGR